MNSIGLESGNAAMCENADLPWLQDVVAVKAEEAWNPVYRDVIILDENNVPIEVYNLTDSNFFPDEEKVENTYKIETLKLDLDEDKLPEELKTFEDLSEEDKQVSTYAINQ